MRTLSGFFIAVLSLFLVSSAFAEEEFPWELFLPAIMSGGSSLTCKDIAGCYSGGFTDNCTGYSVQGRMNVSIKENCSVSIISSYGVTSSGSITKRNGETYFGTGNTGSNGCGSFSFTAVDKGPSISVNYIYNNGKTGVLPSGASGYCKSENRLRTEMLAGKWSFSYISNDYQFDWIFDLKMNTIVPTAGEVDTFTIYGEDEHGDEILAGYSPDLGAYELLDPYVVIKDYYGYYKFSFVGDDRVAGCHYLLTPNYISSCDQFTGKIID